MVFKQLVNNNNNNDSDSDNDNYNNNSITIIILIIDTNIHHHIRIDATVYKLTVIERIEMVTGWRRVAFRLKNNIGALVSPRKAQYQIL